MSEPDSYRILIIDDNPNIFLDFKKILTIKKSDPKIDIIKDKLFPSNTNMSDESTPSTVLHLPTFTIDSAAQGLDGIKMIKQALEDNNPYALAFVDIRMPPGIDGVNTVKKIWEIDENVQIVLCTAYSDYTWEQTVKELGMGDNLLILKKPFDNTAARQLAYNLTKKWANSRKNKQTALREIHGFGKQPHSLSRNSLLYQARHDNLTGLPNRQLLIEYMSTQILTANKTNLQFGVVF